MTDLAEQSFRDIARKWSPYLKTHVRLGLAIRGRDNWNLCFALSAFGPEANPPYKPLSIETNSIRAVREIISIEADAGAYIESILSDPRTVEFSNWQMSLPVSSLATDVVSTYEPLHNQNLVGPKRIPNLTVKKLMGADRRFSALKELDQELLANTLPFDGLADLVAELNIPFPADEILNHPRIEYMAWPPAGLIFENEGEILTILKNDKLSLTLECSSSVDPSKLLVGVKQFKQSGPPVRSSIAGNEFIWAQSTQNLFGKIQIDAPASPVALASLSYEGEFLGKWWLRDITQTFNERLHLHRSIDANDIFQTTFFDNKSEFEDRVELLLSLIGLQTMKYGAIPLFTDAPDILATSSGNHLYVIECTTGDINAKGKLFRLYERAKNIRIFLQTSPQPPVAVIPVVITSLSRSETFVHRDTAAAHGIAIVTREDLVTIFNELNAPRTAAQLYQAVLSLIPTIRGPEDSAK